MVALYFSVFPEEAENYYREVIEAEEKAEQEQERLENAVIKYVGKMKKLFCRRFLKVLSGNLSVLYAKTSGNRNMEAPTPNIMGRSFLSSIRGTALNCCGKKQKRKNKGPTTCVRPFRATEAAFPFL